MADFRILLNIDVSGNNKTQIQNQIKTKYSGLKLEAEVVPNANSEEINRKLKKIEDRLRVSVNVVPKIDVKTFNEQLKRMMKDVNANVPVTATPPKVVPSTSGASGAGGINDLNGLRDAANGAAGANNRLGESSNRAGRAQSGTNRIIQEGSTGINRFGEDIVRSLPKFAQWMVASTVFYQTVNLIKSMVESVMALDKSLVELNKVADMSSGQLDNFTNSVESMANATGKNLLDSVDAVAQFVKAGESLSDSMDLARDALVWTNVADGMVQASDAASMIISQLKAFQKEGITSREVIDKLNEVSNKFAVSSSDLSENIGKSASVLANAGNSFDESLALLTAGTEISRNASKTSNALKSITLRLQGMNDEGDRVLNLVPKMNKDFQKIGITLLDANGEIKNTFTILKEMAEVYPSLNANQKAYYTELAAGKYQAAQLAGILTNFDTALQAVDVSMNSFGSSARENAIYMDSIEGKINLLNTQFSILSKETIDSNLIKSLVDLTTNFLKLLTAIGGLDTIVLALVASFVLLKSRTIELMVINALSAALNLFGIATQGATLQVGLLGIAMRALPFMAVLGVITAVIGAFHYMANESERSAKKVVELAEELSKLEDQKKSVVSVTEEIGRFRSMINVNGMSSLSTEETQRWRELNNQIKELVPTAQGTFDAYGNFTLSATENTETLAKAVQDLIDEANLERLALLTKRQAEITDQMTSMFANGISPDSNAQELRDLSDELVITNQQIVASAEAFKILDSASQEALSKMMENLVPGTEQFNLFNEALASSPAEAIELLKAFEEFPEIRSEIERITAAQAALDISNSQTTLSAEALGDALSNLEKASSSLSDVQKELTEDGIISDDTLQSLLSSYEGMGEIIALYQLGLADASEVVQELQAVEQDRVDAYNAGLQEMLGDSTRYYQDIVELNGDAVNQMAEDYNIDLQNIQTLNQLKIAVNASLWENMKVNNASVFEQFKLDYGVDLRNMASWAQAKQEIMNKLAQITNNANASVMATAEDVRAGLIANMEADPMYRVMSPALRAAKLEAIEEQVARLTTYRNLIEETNVDFNSLVDSSFKSMPVKKAYSGSIDSSSKKEKSKKEEYTAEIDIYHKYTQALKDVNVQLEENSRLSAESPKHDDQVKLMIMRINLLKEEADVTKELSDAKKKELNDEVWRLNQLGYAVKWNTENNEILIENYDQLSKAKGDDAKEQEKMIANTIKLNDEINGFSKTIAKNTDEINKNAKEVDALQKAQKQMVQDLILQFKESQLSGLRKEIDGLIDSLDAETKAWEKSTKAIQDKIDATDKYYGDLIKESQEAVEQLEWELGLFKEATEIDRKKELGLPENKAIQDQIDAYEKALKLAQDLKEEEALKLKIQQAQEKINERANALEKAKKVKKLVYRRGKGWVYEQDTKKVEEEQKKYDEALKEKQEAQDAYDEWQKKKENQNNIDKLDAINKYYDDLIKAQEEKVREEKRLSEKEIRIWEQTAKELNESRKNEIERLEKDYNEMAELKRTEIETLESYYDREMQAIEDARSTSIQSLTDLASKFDELGVNVEKNMASVISWINQYNSAVGSMDKIDTGYTDPNGGNSGSGGGNAGGNDGGNGGGNDDEIEANKRYLRSLADKSNKDIGNRKWAINQLKDLYGVVYSEQYEFLKDLLANGSPGNKIWAKEQLDMGYFQDGGVVDYSGIAMLHGSKAQPEMVVNSGQVGKLWKLINEPSKVSEYNTNSTNNQETSMIVNINANFPNATDREEIKNALLGLPNAAIQSAYKRGK